MGIEKLSQLQISDINSVKDAADYVISAHDAVKEEYIFTVMGDFVKYGVAIWVAIYQIFKAVRKVTAYMRKRKAEKRINELIHKLSEYTKKEEDI